MGKDQPAPDGHEKAASEGGLSGWRGLGRQRNLLCGTVASSVGSEPT